MEILKKYWPTFIVVSVIIYATLNDDPIAPDFPAIPYLDKLIHAIMFGGLLSAWSFDLCRAGHALHMRLLIMVAIVCIFAGAVDEVFQHYFTAARSGDVFDWFADVFGILVAFFTAPSAIRAVLRKHSS